MRRAQANGRIEGTWQGTLRDGTRLELPRQSLMTWAVAFEGEYDRGPIELTAGFIQPGTLALDVGASLGLWTVQLARVAASQGAQVWAFEPNLANTVWIRRNVELNELENTVTVREVGLGDATETMTLVSAEYGVGNGAIAVGDKEATPKHPRMSISVQRLDDIELPVPVSFVKIDTEGYEAAFLRGASELIKRDRPVIFGEFSTGWLKRRGENLRAELAGLDYDVQALKRTKPRILSGAADHRWHRVEVAGDEPLPRNLLLRPRI
ncbi:MAG TPA: FkbM family methyltransferase [Solirubrobacteraceae bacterium]|jgi:FkbM family methyltransferase|nr:FkbM family methyltransferase [Solirubrobacteraceae bacterium]